jgi:anti-sigma B factor antagonist
MDGRLRGGQVGMADNGIGSAPFGLDRSTGDDGTTRLAVTGEIDMSTVDQFRAALMRVVGEPSVSSVTLDFESLDFIDSAGVEAVLAGMRVAADRKIPYVVVNPYGRVLRVLEILGVDTLLMPA